MKWKEDWWKKTDNCFTPIKLSQQKNLTSTLSSIILISSDIYSSVPQNPHLPLTQVQKSRLFYLLFILAWSLSLETLQWHFGLYTPFNHRSMWSIWWETDNIQGETNNCFICPRLSNKFVQSCVFGKRIKIEKLFELVCWSLCVHSTLIFLDDLYQNLYKCQPWSKNSEKALSKRFYKECLGEFWHMIFSFF